MAEPKFTKGPWSANLHHTMEHADKTYGFIFADGIVPIATVMLGVRGMSQDAGRANAHLIAANPELYETVAELLAEIEAEAISGTTINKARHVLAKARGEHG